MNDSIRVCVIGAGAAGLCVARHFSQLPETFAVDIIEETASIGDTWVTNLQQHEVNAQYEYNSISKTLVIFFNFRTNLPKDIMAFPDFPFDPHLPSFLSHSDMLKYLQQYADYFRLMPLIHFSTAVVHVKPKGTDRQQDPIGDELHPPTKLPKQTFTFNQWIITMQNLITRQSTTETYDAVVICNG